MFTINIDKECACFKKSAYENNMQFSNKDDALLQAKLMESHMNQKFCQKHLFTLSENANTFQITRSDKPKESAGGCCGGGHCS